MLSCQAQRGGLESNVANQIASAAVGRGSTVRDRILETASALFYRNGVRAVGVDLIVRESGIAKTSLYRHFATKDVLVAAFLKEEDGDRSEESRVGKAGVGTGRSWWSPDH